MLGSETQVTPSVEETELRFCGDQGTLSLQDRVLVRGQLPRDTTPETCRWFPSSIQLSTGQRMHVRKLPKAGKELTEGVGLGKVPSPPARLKNHMISRVLSPVVNNFYLSREIISPGLSTVLVLLNNS